MAEFISAGGLSLASDYAIDLPAGTRLYANETTVGGSLSKDATVSYFGQSSGFYFVLVSTGDRDFYPDGLQRSTLVMVKPQEFVARPYKRPTAPDPAPDCTAAVQKAVTAQKNTDALALASAIDKAAIDERERIALAEANRIRNT